jgi:hypothetical protein
MAFFLLASYTLAVRNSSRLVLFVHGFLVYLPINTWLDAVTSLHASLHSHSRHAQVVPIFAHFLII